MASRRRRKPLRSAAARAPASGAWAEGFGLALVGLSLLLGLSLWSHAASDPAFSMAPVLNKAGPTGATLSALARGAFGSAAWVAAARRAD